MNIHRSAEEVHREAKRHTGTRPLTDEEFDARFWMQVEKTESCWLWRGCIDSNGYGVFNRKRKLDRVHRYSYSTANGPIPKGLHLDHLCRVRNCVNPAHLEAVTSKENWRRGMSPAAISVATNKCKRGHELSGEHLYVRPDGWRGCLTCRHENWKRWYAENKKKTASNEVAREKVRQSI